MTITVKFEPKEQFKIGEVEAKEFHVTGVGFIQFAKMGTIAAKAAATDNDVQKNLFRERLKRQVAVEMADGSTARLTDDTIPRLPIKAALRLKQALNDVSEETTGGTPKISIDGDGISKAVMMTLGTPLSTGDGKNITDLEFIAETLADLEDAVIADNKIDQAIAIMNIAKPASGDVNLLRLPSWALDQITMTDGLFIMTRIAPRFLEVSPAS
ncbi:hypothetical protein ABGN05_24950 [Aquibium sp. LZ166]|uniref:Phage major capsid protein n=1 Tax=Aquibium pacificus TaxID=3153579 RepID=A0ABV3SQ21_9HYPH